MTFKNASSSYRSAANAATDNASHAVLDDPIEWPTFSRQDTADSSLWDSHLVIEGMHCAACANTVERALKSVPGVLQAEVNGVTGRAAIKWSASQTRPSDWVTAVNRAGYGAMPASDADALASRKKVQRLALWRWLETRLRNKTAGALDDLMRRLPESVERQMSDGSFERISSRRIRQGDVLRILPGEAFPADGELIEGETQADEALLTGESRPVKKTLHSELIAGSHNLSSAILMRVSKVGQDTRYAQIVTLMEKAATDKPRLAILADRIARPFLLLVLLAALGAVVYWWPTDPARGLMAAV
ncbi:MAG: hypothetical protein CVU24_18265, partial [Betaproteobacteria bacterium HGW-Betaproteobacteria-18]